MTTDNAWNGPAPKELAASVGTGMGSIDSTFLDKLTALDWDWAAEKQKELREAAMKGHVLTYAPRQLGKGLVLYATWIQMNQEGPRWDAKYINSSHTKSSQILLKYSTDPLLQTFNAFLAEPPTATKAVLRNGATFEVLPCVEASVKGQTSQIVWVDDADRVCQKHPEVISAAVAQTLAVTGAHLWFAANNASGNFRNLKLALAKHDEIPMIQYTVQDMPEAFRNKWLQNASIVRDVMEAMSGEGYALSQLDNFDINTENEWLDPDEVEFAFNSKAVPQTFTKVVIGADRGFNHPAAMICLGLNGGHIYELDSWQAKSMSNREFDEAAITFEKSCRAWNNGNKVTLYMESNEGGKADAKDLRADGLILVMSNFVKDVSPDGTLKEGVVPKGHVIGILKNVLADGKIHLSSAELKRQMLRYNGDKVKDDLFDGMIHGIYAVQTHYSGAV